MPVRNKLLEHAGISWLVLIFMLILTFAIWQFFEQQTQSRKQEHFLYLANKEVNLIENRMQGYTQVLRGAAALFASSEYVSRDEWHEYIKELKLDESLPGILGTGYAKVIPFNMREAHEQEIQSEGFSDYKISPFGKHELITSIIYLEPFNERNKRAFGYDMFSEPVRRTAMIGARDSGEATLTGKVILLQELDNNIQPGFIMYLPVYQNNVLHDNTQSRREKLQGFVYSPFRTYDLMNGVFSSSAHELSLELFDGEPLEDNLLYRPSKITETSKHMVDIKLTVAGREWTARLRSTKNFDGGIANIQRYLILAAGISLNFVVFTMLLINSRSKREMREAAQALEQSHDSYQTLVENVPGTVFRCQAQAPWQLEHVSAGIEELFGEPPARFMNKECAFRQFTHPDDKKMLLDSITLAISEHSSYNIEYRIYTSNYDLRWVTERGCASYDASGQAISIDGVILDTTERKMAELATLELAFYDALTELPNRRLMLDRLGQHIASNTRTNNFDGLLFIDIDNFKTINDTLGHKAGDTLLIEIARRLLSNTRNNDTVARLGGDEFVVILDNLSTDKVEATSFAQKIGEKIIGAINQPYQLENSLQHCSCSIGLTIFSGQNSSVDSLLHQADEAMYEAKSAGRNCFKVYTLNNSQ